MKNYFSILSVAIIAMTLSCSSNKSKVKIKEDPTNMVVPENSNATNPSLADTAYSNKTKTIKDSTKK
jgi:hypothetical protein